MMSEAVSWKVVSAEQRFYEVRVLWYGKGKRDSKMIQRQLSTTECKQSKHHTADSEKKVP